MALTDDTIFAHYSLRFDQIGYSSCHMRAPIVSCETNLGQSQRIVANHVKKTYCLRVHLIGCWCRHIHLYYSGFHTISSD